MGGCVAVGFVDAPHISPFGLVKGQEARLKKRQRVMDDNLRFVAIPVGVGIMIGTVVGAVIGGSMAIGLGIAIGIIVGAAIGGLLRAANKPES